jgi:TIR domain/Sel1 repeat
MIRREKPTREAATPRLGGWLRTTHFAECANIQCSDGSRAMADVAHDASGPASPKSGDVAPQQASRPDSLDKGKLRVFISYSRDDLYFADQLNAALDLCGFECIIDREGISGGEKWKLRLGSMISEADTVVFVLSPTSARSEVCAWEVEEAARFGKRILPVNCRPLEGASPPPRLRDLNYIFFYADPKVSDSGFGTGLASLVAALNTDFDWLREHTRYLQRATEWDRGGRPANRLLSGDDIAEAKAWAARRPKSVPEPTALHLDFIRASEEEAEARSSAQRKQLEVMAAAQAERETALRQAEDAQRKRATMARIRNIAFVLLSIFAVLAGWLYLRADKLRQEAEKQRAMAEVQRVAAEEQRAVAEEQREQADHILASATKIYVASVGQMDTNTKKEAFALFQTGADHGDAASMGTLGQFYETGFGVTQDYAKAREWYQKAADKGSTAAMASLGLVYQNGRGARGTTPRRASGSRRPPTRARRAPCSSSARFTTMVRAWRGTTLRRASGLRRPLTRARRTPCTSSACFTQTRRTTPRRVSGSRRPPTRAI